MSMVKVNLLFCCIWFNSSKIRSQAVHRIADRIGSQSHHSRLSSNLANCCYSLAVFLMALSSVFNYFSRPPMYVFAKSISYGCLLVFASYSSNKICQCQGHQWPVQNVCSVSSAACTYCASYVRTFLYHMFIPTLAVVFSPWKLKFLEAIALS